MNGVLPIFLKRTERCGQHCEQSELHLHFELTKVNQKWFISASFWKPEACGQTVFPDRSVLMGQILLENAIMEKFKCYILNGQKLIKKAKNGQFWLFLKTWSLRSNSVSRQVSFSGQKSVKNTNVLRFTSENMIFGHF